MATIPLPPDFKEFLGLLNVHGVRYLLIGGYAVSHYGYPRPTGDIDIWIAVDPVNGSRIADAFHNFGFKSVEPGLFVEHGKGVHFGHPPMRIEVLTRISGVEFEECFRARNVADLDGIQVPVISLEHLKQNKLAAGRFKDLEDVQQLEP